MATCPNKNTKEWKQVLSEAQNNDKLAMELWVKKGYSNINSINQEDTSDEVTDEDKKEFNTEEDSETSEKTDLGKLVDRTKVHLERRIRLLKLVKTKDNTVQENKIRDLINNMEALDEVASINEYINEAYLKSVSLTKNMEQLIADSKSTTNTSNLIEKLTVINDQVNGSADLLGEIIDNQDIVDLFEDLPTTPNVETDKNLDSETEEDISIKEKLKIILANRASLKRRINVEGIPLIADWLLTARSSYVADTTQDLELAQSRIKKTEELFEKGEISEKTKNKRIQRQNTILERISSVAITREGLISTLRQASREDGVLDFMIGPMITSPDTVLALFAKKIKDQIEKARLKDIVAKQEIADAFIKYNKVNSTSQDNPQKFNEGIYEIVQERTNNKDSNGDYIYREEVHFVTKFDMKKRSEVSKEWFKNNPEPLTKEKKGSKLTADEGRTYSAWVTKKNNFFEGISKQKSEKEKDELDAKMKRQVDANIITQEEYNEWLNSKERKWAQSEPIDTFLSAKWKAMYNSKDEPINPMGEYHKKLTDTYYAAQDNIPTSQRPGARVPSIAKSDLERLLDKGVVNLVKTNVKEAFNVQSYDTDFGQLGIDTEGQKFLPVFYVNPIDIADQSFDLAKTVLLFNQMANKYEALNEVSGEMSLVKSIIKNRKVPEFNQYGKRKIDAFANKFGLTEYLKQNGDSFSKKHLDAFLDMVVYGEMQKQELIGNISATKLTNTVTGFSALTSIAADLLKGVANNLQGNIQLVIEAKSGEFFNAKNLRFGKMIYAKNIPGVLGDFGKPTPTSFMGKLVELYDPIQGDFTDSYGRLVTAGVANKLFRTDTLFFNQYFGEYALQVSGMIALMDATTVRDKQSKEEITLYEAHEKYGVTEAFDKVEFITENKDGSKEYRDFTEKDRRSFQDRTHALNKKMHGVYNSFDKGTIQRYSVGRLAMMYRKHMLPGYMRRFARYRYDEELGSATEGFYSTFFNRFMKDLFTYKSKIGKEWSTYSPREKANIKRAITELSLIVSLAGLIFILSSMADDDEDLKDNYAFNFLLYEAVRMRSETAQYIYFGDAYRTAKSPSAALSTVSRTLKFGNQIMPWNITEGYKRKQGIWEKGDNKAWAYFVRLIGLPGYNIKPREAVKIYESLTL